MVDEKRPLTTHKIMMPSLLALQSITTADI